MRSVCVLLYSAMSALACSDAHPLDAVPQEPATLYASLRLNHRAIVLSLQSPYDTVQLAATAYNVLGEPLTTSPAVRYFRLSETDESIHVDDAGFVTAERVTFGTRVIAELIIDGIRHADTATIMVRNDAPLRTIERFEFGPLPPDSNVLWAGVWAAPDIWGWTRIYDGNGLIMTSDVIVSYSWNNHNLGLDVYGEFPWLDPLTGETYIYAETYAYGRSWRDSALFRRVPPRAVFVEVGRVVPVDGEPKIQFLPGTLTVEAGTTVIFVNGWELVWKSIGLDSLTRLHNKVARTQAFPGSQLVWVDSVDILFSEPHKVEAGHSFGHIPSWGLGFSRMQQSYLYEYEGWPADGGHGNIAAFAATLCLRVTTTGVTGGCGVRQTNVDVMIDGGHRSRRFPQPGTYHYHSARFPGVVGTIIVTPTSPEP